MDPLVTHIDTKFFGITNEIISQIDRGRTYRYRYIIHVVLSSSENREDYCITHKLVGLLCAETHVYVISYAYDQY